MNLRLHKTAGEQQSPQNATEQGRSVAAPASGEPLPRSRPAPLRFTALDVQLAWARGEPDEAPTTRELDSQLLRDLGSGDARRFDLHRRHRIAQGCRSQREACAPSESELPL